ncbi:MAG: helix-turn-helix domain-containing protein [Acidobacteria bacterium]|nr:helix-turn-helix domain-containing protein [Acidobacteriota bacterium]
MDANSGRLTGAVTENLDAAKSSEDLARGTFHSRSHFFRLFRAFSDETPAAMRRRLLLERAAWHLTNTRTAVTEIAFDAGYGSLEAFTRAFRKAFRLSPSMYRRLSPSHFHLAAANGIHYFSAKKGIETMDLFDRFAGTDSYHTRRLLEHAAGLTDEQLDRPISTAVKLLPWEKADRNLREILERLVFTKEVWAAAMGGGEMPQMGGPPSSVARLTERFQRADNGFQSILNDIRNRGAWDDTFVDALCEPPEKFTFGGTFAHVITFNTYRRLTALDALRRLGVEIDGFGCPMEYEASQAVEK